MTKQEELKVYKISLTFWEKPCGAILNGNIPPTSSGFCYFFNRTAKDLDLPNSVKDELTECLLLEYALPTLSSFRTVPKIEFDEYWFDGPGRTEKGRLQRVDALIQSIELLEIELKAKSHD